MRPDIGMRCIFALVFLLYSSPKNGLRVVSQEGEKSRETAKERVRSRLFDGTF